VDDRFDSGGIPSHWSLSSGKYGSGAGGCAAPSQDLVDGGSLVLLMSYRTTGTCGAGWYTAVTRARSTTARAPRPTAPCPGTTRAPPRRSRTPYGPPAGMPLVLPGLVVRGQTERIEVDYLTIDNEP